MDNPLKNKRLARTCTRGLKKSLCRWAVQVGQGKRGKMDRGKAGESGGKSRIKEPGSPPIRPLSGCEERISWAVRKTVKESGLGRDPEKKAGCAEAVLVNKSLDEAFGVTPGRPRPQAKGQKVACRFFPERHLLSDPDIAQLVKFQKTPVPPAKSLQNDPQPAGNEPGGDKAFRVHANRCPIETLPAHLPALKRQKKGPDNCADRVLKVRDQLNRQEGKGPSPIPAHKTSNRDLLLPELGEELNYMPPIRSDLSIAFWTVADGAHCTNGR